MGEVCEVSPYSPTYDAVKEIPIAGCGTVWTLPRTGCEHLLVGVQFLFIGTMLP